MDRTEEPAPPTTPPATGSPPARPRARSIVLFIAALLACAAPLFSPAWALLLGIACGLAGFVPFPAQAKRWSRVILQIGIVMLGLRTPLGRLADAAMDGLLLSIATIVGSILLGLLLARLLRVDRETGLLISAGTGICGGSAIAAVGTTIRASASAMAIATACVFLLNAFALWTFPPIGHALGLSDKAFGTWAGVGIHDVASVVGAASSYQPHDEARNAVVLDTANVVKMTRVLWIFPLCLFAGWWMRRERPEPRAPRSWATIFPLFIAGFLAASMIATLVEIPESVLAPLKEVSAAGFRVALFLVGSGVSVAALKSVGWRALLMAVLLWVALAGGSLLAVR